MAASVVIGADIFMFGGGVGWPENYTNALWKLTYDRKGRFVWTKITYNEQSQTPSPRRNQQMWECDGKPWSFGGYGISPNGYLHEHGEFKELANHSFANNQLECFDPEAVKWTNSECFGTIPYPSPDYVSARINNTVVLYDQTRNYNAFYQLDLLSLHWSKVTTGETCPSIRCFCSFTAIDGEKIIQHGGFDGDCFGLDDTWVLDLPSKTWSQHSAHNGQTRYVHAAVKYPDTNTVLLVGGCLHNTNIFKLSMDTNINEGTRTLQGMSLECIDKHREQLDLQTLPKIYQREFLLPGEKAATVGQGQVWNGRLRRSRKHLNQ
jgi:hypothetical protein